MIDILAKALELANTLDHYTVPHCRTCGNPLLIKEDRFGCMKCKTIIDQETHRKIAEAIFMAEIAASIMNFRRLTGT